MTFAYCLVLFVNKAIHFIHTRPLSKMKVDYNVYLKTKQTRKVDHLCPSK